MDEELKRKGLLLAIKRKELDEFLRGTGLYRIGYNQYAPGNTMLNLTPAMDVIYKYYRDEPDKRIDLHLESMLLEWLTWKSGIGVFAVFSFLSYQLQMEKLNVSPFKINKEKLLKEFYKYFDIFKDKLKKVYKYEGEGLQEGLYEFMILENKTNTENYNINILNI